MIDFTVFGILLMVIILLSAIFCDEEKIMFLLINLNIIFSLFIDIGFVFRIVGFEFNYYRFFMPITILIYILKSKRPVAIDKKYFTPIVILYISIMMGFLITFIFKINSFTNVAIGRSTIGDEPLTSPYFTSRNIVRTFDLFIFIFYLLILLDYGFFKKEKLDRFIKYFLLYTKVFFVIIIIEFIFTYNGYGQLFRNSLFLIFGQNSESVVVTSYQRGGAYMLMGTLQEPSHLVYILLILYSLYIKNYKISDVFIGISWVIAFLTTSSSCILCIPFSMMGFVFSNKITNRLTRKVKIYMVCGTVFLLLFILMINNDVNALLSLTIDKFNRFLNLNINDMNLRSSSDVRAYSIYVSMQAFLSNIIFGIGFGTVTTYSAIVSLLANLGLAGGLSYSYTLYKIINPKLDIRYIVSFSIILIYLFAVGMLGTIYNVLIILMFLPTYYEENSNRFF